MKRYDFDTVVDRRNTHSFKWDGNVAQFGRADILPFWVADMDFATAPPIIEALKKRLEHPVFGYSIRSQAYDQAVLGWLERRHQWRVPHDWLAYSATGVVQAMEMLIHQLSQRGDEIVIQTPAYKPLFHIVTRNGRVLKENRLKFGDGRYTMDFHDLRRQITPRTKVMILCSPHNPSGRVWREEELLELSEICVQHDLTVLSDEIHADLVYPSHRHRPLASLSEAIADRCVCLISASKTFNISGLQLATLIIANRTIRDRYNEALDTAQITLGNIFGEEAVRAAYTHGDAWLDEAIAYIGENLKALKDFFSQNLPWVDIVEPEGTYLVWLDMRRYPQSPREIQTRLIEKGRVGLYEGAQFGEEQVGFFRINIACPRSILMSGLNRIKEALL